MLSENLYFDGPVYLYHGMADTEVPYLISLEITKNIIGTQDVKLLLDKDAGHRLSDSNHLKTIINLIDNIKIYY